MMYESLALVQKKETFTENMAYEPRLLWHKKPDFMAYEPRLYGIRTPTFMPYEPILLVIGVVFEISKVVISLFVAARRVAMLGQARKTSSQIRGVRVARIQHTF